MLVTVRDKSKVNNLPFKKEYDNIIDCGDNVFILYKNGKIGLCKYDNEHLKMICECEYDLVDRIYNGLILSNDICVCLYKFNTGSLNKYTEIEVEYPYIYACDEEYQYILHQDTGNVIYKKKCNEHTQSWYEFCGNTRKGPVFYDYRNCEYIYPTDNGYMYYEEILHHPLIINKENVLNIVFEDNKLGVIDSFGNSIIDNKYDRVKIDLCITASDKNEILKKIVSIPKCVFDKDTMSDIKEW